jgi:hypothetical protein
MATSCRMPAGAYSTDEPEKANFPDGWLEPTATVSWCYNRTTASRAGALPLPLRWAGQQ